MNNKIKLRRGLASLFISGYWTTLNYKEMENGEIVKDNPNYMIRTVPQDSPFLADYYENYEINFRNKASDIIDLFLKHDYSNVITPKYNRKQIAGGQKALLDLLWKQIEATIDDMFKSDDQLREYAHSDHAYEIFTSNDGDMREAIKKRLKEHLFIEADKKLSYPSNVYNPIQDLNDIRFDDKEAIALTCAALSPNPAITIPSDALKEISSAWSKIFAYYHTRNENTGINHDQYQQDYMEVKDEVDELTRNLYDEYMKIFSEFPTGEYELKFYVESANGINRYKSISKNSPISRLFGFTEDTLQFKTGNTLEEEEIQQIRDVVGTMVAYLQSMEGNIFVRVQEKDTENNILYANKYGIQTQVRVDSKTTKDNTIEGTLTTDPAVYENWINLINHNIIDEADLGSLRDYTMFHNRGKALGDPTRIAEAKAQRNRMLNLLLWLHRDNLREHTGITGFQIFMLGQDPLGDDEPINLLDQNS